MKTVQVNRRVITINNADRVYFPEDDITKGDLLDYYQEMAPILLPHVRDRLLVMQRFPEGIHAEGFFQKTTPDYFPAWIPTKRVKQRTGSGSNKYLLCKDAATLIYVASQGCITLHRWLSKVDSLDYPDTVVFDLDPGKTFSFSFIVEVAFLLKEQIESHGLTAWLMTTGSRGLHVVIPIKREHRFSRIRDWARDIAKTLVEQYPQWLTLESNTKKRGNRLLIDIMRNAFGATAVVPYAVRPLPTAPVATPLHWEELEASGMSSQRYTLHTVVKRVMKYGDAWKDIRRYARTLSW